MSARNIRAFPPSVMVLGEGNWIGVGVVVATLGLAALLFMRPFDEAASLWGTTFAIAALVAWIVVQDLRTFTIADSAIVSLAMLAVASRWAAGDPALAIALDGLLTGGVLYLFREIYYRRKGVDGLGLGDVKLAAAGGLLVGAVAFAWVLFAASVLALVLVAAQRLGVRLRNEGVVLDGPHKVAFGAVLAPAILVAWLVEGLPILLPSAGF